MVVSSFRSSSPAAGVVLFVAYALGMGLMVGVAATAVALARRGFVTRMRRAGGLATRLGGAVLVVAGAYVAWYGAWELRVLHAGAGNDPVVSAAATLQAWLASSVQRIGVAGFAVVLGAVVILVSIPAWRLRRRSPATGRSTGAAPLPHRVEEHS